MNFGYYPKNHGKSGWPSWNPKIYQDMLDRARKAGAPYPNGPLPYDKAPKNPAILAR